MLGGHMGMCRIAGGIGIWDICVAVGHSGVGDVFGRAESWVLGHPM